MLAKILLTLTLFPLMAWARDEADRGSASVLEEVVVSGYRLTSPRELDTSLTLLDGDTIRNATVQHFEELVPLVPNMNLSGEGSRARYFQLRGLGEREQYEGAPNHSVGFFIDDIDLSGVGGVGSLFDIGQVEVLRGPQSARYGSSALAGVIYMRSADPTDETSVEGEASAGGDGLFSAGAVAGGKLHERLNGRIAVQHFRQDGFRVNEHFGRDDTNDRYETTLRAKLDWKFAPGWQALLTGLVLDFDNGYDAWTPFNDDIVHSDRPGQDSQETLAGSLRIAGSVGERMDLVAITSYADSDILFSFDGDWGSGDYWQAYGDYIYDFAYVNPRRRDSIGQELRLMSSPGGRLFGGTTDWVVGVYGRRLEEDNAISSTGIYDDSAEEAFCTPCLTDRQIESHYRADTLALFGSLDAKLDAHWTLSAGLRYERWEAEYRDVWQDINFPVPPDGNSCSQFDCRPDENLWGGHLALSYDWQSGVRAYTRIARGFKTGGFNPSLAALQSVARLGPEFIAYDPETLWNYELGLKGAWLDGRLLADLSAFYMERDDAQLSQSSQQVPFDPNSFVFVTYNGDARVQGLETSLSWQWTDRFRVHGALGLLDSRIRDTASTAAISPGAIGRDLAHAPSYTLNLGATWSGDTGWFARVDLNASDAYFFDISHNERSSSYQTVNLRLGRSWGPWTVSAWGRNVFDEDYATRGFFFGLEPPAFANRLFTKFGDPAHFGITLQYGN